MVYINGIKASKKDLAALKKALAQGKKLAIIHTTKKAIWQSIRIFEGA